MPLYNKAPYVEKAIRSVLAQTFQEFELIVVDDGSKDNSLEICHGVLNASVRRGVLNTPILHTPEICDFQIIEQQNAGVSTARNNGVKIARYEYVAFLDADDWWESTFLEEMKKLIIDFPEAAMYASSYFIVKNGNHKIAPVALSPNFESGHIDYIKTYAERLCMPIWTGAVILRKNIFNEMQGFKSQLKLGEDFDLWLRIALNYKVAFLNKPLAYYNQDVELQNRAIGKVYDIKHNYLWEMDYLAEEEAKNKDLKKVLDGIRVTSVYMYFLSDKYREQAREILNKVDWSSQSPELYKRYYQTPIWWQKFKFINTQYLLSIKNRIIKHIRK